MNNTGTLHLLTSDKEAKSFSDMKGKTVYATGKGGYYEYYINYILTENGIDPKNDVIIEYKEQDELTDLALNGTAEFIFIPEPYATKVVMENENMNRFINLVAQWEKAAGTKPVQGVVVARTEYIEQNPEYIEQFLFQNEVSLNFLNVDGTQGANFLFDNNYFSTFEIAQACIPACNLVFMKGEEMKPEIKGVFDVFYGVDPASLGGAIPDDGIFY